MITCLFGCKNHYMVSQKDLKDFPCETKTTGVNVRVKNAGTTFFTKFTLLIGDQKYPFAGCMPGDTTCYKNVPYIWKRNSFDVDIYYDEGEDYKKGSGHAYMWRADTNTNIKIKSGYYTINVITKGTESEPAMPALELKMESGK